MFCSVRDKTELLISHRTNKRRQLLSCRVSTSKANNSRSIAGCPGWSGDPVYYHTQQEPKVNMTDFLFCLIKSPQCTGKYSAKIKRFNLSFCVFWLAKNAKFFFRRGTKLKDPNRRLGMIVASFQDLKLHGKQICKSFSYCELLNSQKMVQKCVV